MLSRLTKTGVATVLLTLVHSHYSWACVTLSESILTRPSITEETALIVWDEKNQTEHFIRTASFEGGSKNFGFLVPTPSRPQLGKADEAIFHTLHQQTMPKRETRTREEWSFVPLILAPVFNNRLRNTFGSAGNQITTSIDESRRGASAVSVIEEKRVGDFNATVLKARSSRELAYWLDKNGFKADKETEQWLHPYVKNDWTITAFKIAKGREVTGKLNAVRLSFKTKRPFYPYREPASARKRTSYWRNLRVYWVGKSNVSGAIEAPQGNKKWPGGLLYAAPLEAGSRKGLEKTLKGQNVSGLGQARLAVFDDSSSPRPGFGELYFQSETNQKDLVPEPIITWKTKRFWFPPDVILAVLAGLALLIRGRRRKHNSSITDNQNELTEKLA